MVGALDMTGEEAGRTRSTGARVLLLFGSDGIGGIERRLDILIDAWASEGMTCELVALTGSSSPHGILAHRPITVLDPVRSRSPWRSWRRLHRLRHLIRARDIAVVLAFGQFANALAATACAGLGVHVVLSEIVSPFTVRRRWWNRTVMQAYRLADALVVQTQRLAHDIRCLPAPDHIIVIPNPISPAALAPADGATARDPRIVAAGRLVPHKRYADLVEAFASLAPDFPDWSVEILGDGPERARLQAMIERLQLTHRITLPGHVAVPWRRMQSAAILAHCAEIEGFCNTILEAMAAGCAVVSSDCPYGPREILSEECGLLYPPGDVGTLTAQLRRLMGDEVLRDRMARVGYRSLDRYRVKAIAQRWRAEIVQGLDRRTHA